MNFFKIIHLILTLALGTLHSTAPSQHLLLLQTFGTTKQPGRTVAGDTTERSITLQLAEHISSTLNEGDETAAEAFIINPAGQKKKDPLEVLNKINQVRKATVIQITASQSKEVKPSCHLFFRCYNPLTDQIKRPLAPLTPIPLEDVYLLNFGQSKALANTLATALRTQANNFLDVKDPVGIPLAGARGIRHPVIQIEVSLNKNSSIFQIGNAIAQSIKKLFPL